MVATKMGHSQRLFGGLGDKWGPAPLSRTKGLFSQPPLLALPAISVTLWRPGFLGGQKRAAPQVALPEAPIPLLSPSLGDRPAQQPFPEQPLPLGLIGLPLPEKRRVPLLPCRGSCGGLCWPEVGGAFSTSFRGRSFCALPLMKCISQKGAPRLLRVSSLSPSPTPTKSGSSSVQSPHPFPKKSQAEEAGKAALGK